MKNHLILGNWNALCDSCGRKFKALDLQKRWDGLMVCKEDWEMRHPQDLLRVQKEQITVPWSRPYPAEDTYIPWNLSLSQADSLVLEELATKTFVKRIGYDPTNAGFNAYILGSHELNYSGVSSSNNDERVLFTETFLAALARTLTDTTTLSETLAKTITKRFADTVSIAESLWFAEQEHNADTLSLSEVKAFVVTKPFAESITVSESTVYLITTQTALDGAALNTISLG